MFLKWLKSSSIINDEGLTFIAGRWLQDNCHRYYQSWWIKIFINTAGFTMFQAVQVQRAYQYLGGHHNQKMTSFFWLILLAMSFVRNVCKY